MSREEDNAWRMIAVLQSTVSLPPALSLRLFQAAVRLHHEDADVEELTDESVACGVVRRLRKALVIGTFGGPGYEAEVETPRGKGFVRFLVTEEGLAYTEAREARRRAWQRTHWN